MAPSRHAPGLTARPARRPGVSGPLRGPILKSQQEWKTWPFMIFEIRNLPRDVTTFQLWNAFMLEGIVSRIDIFDDPSGRKNGNGKVFFSPPPDKDFWSSGTYSIKLSEHAGYRQIAITPSKPSRSFQITSPIRKHIKYPETMKLVPKTIDFGFMFDQTTMMDMHTAKPLKNMNLAFEVDLRMKRLKAYFPCTRQHDNEYFFKIPFGQLEKIYEIGMDDEHFSFVISLKSPPQFFRKLEDIQLSHKLEANSWTEMDVWYRQTDIVQDHNILSRSTVSLQKPPPIIDIGRWTTYRFTFKKTHTDSMVYDKLKNALQDFNIPIVPFPGFDIRPAEQATIWPLLDFQSSDTDPYGLGQLQGTANLPFAVRYQLEVCISQGVLNEHNLGHEFVDALTGLANENARKAQSILEYFSNEEKRIIEPMSIFQDEEAQAYSPNTKIPHYCAYVRKATITPSSIIYSSPTVETSNRVIRRFSRYGDRFLRVQFTDEVFEGRINSSADRNTNDPVFTRVYRTLANGITIGDRHYVFLAFGSSQFRENGAYFFCPAPDLTPSDIRRWMGNFSHINVVAKYAARLGQCFSTTRDIKCSQSGTKIVKIPDVIRNGWTFTDGVGKISQFMADMITAEFNLLQPAPSVFQFRMGGCKGVLAVDPNIRNPREIYIRPSQEKFKAPYLGLEIIRCSRFSVATLNRQTITILSCLGVEDQVFTNMLTSQLSNYESAMTEKMVALSLLQRYIDDNQATIAIAGMILNGFMDISEPFMMSVLHLWRAWSIKLLKEKARIIVEEGAFLLGCVDETNTLRGHKSRPPFGPDSLASKNIDELPQIFVQVPDRASGQKGRYVVIEGICLVGRNPSLHPGDMRVVNAVNVPALHHLRDVVVFSSQGDRDVPSMCSGGDLDGDDFFVIWDKHLTPKEWNHVPMNYSPPTPRTVSRQVVPSDLMKFFVRYMKNDTLPTIAHAHLAQCDFLDRGPKDPKALKLADLHSRAVDYVKTGEPAVMEKSMKPRRWPHYMEKKNQESYDSKTVLGQLYDLVERVDFSPKYDKTFDRRILSAYKDKVNNSMLKDARQLKSQYDTAMKRIMAQHEIRTEFEVWSTFILSRPRIGSDYKLQEEMGRVSDSLKDRFRAMCIDRAGGKEFATLGPFVVAMYRVTFEEMLFALQECSETKTVGGREVPKRKKDARSMPLISFPWLLPDILGRIASGTDQTQEIEDLGLTAIKPTRTRRAKRGGNTGDDEGDFIKTEEGIVHRGEILDIFRPDNEEDFDSESILDFSDNDPLSEEILETQHLEKAFTELNFGLEDMLETSPRLKVPPPADDFAQTRDLIAIDLLIAEDSLGPSSADESRESAPITPDTATPVTESEMAHSYLQEIVGGKTQDRDEDAYDKLMRTMVEKHSEFGSFSQGSEAHRPAIHDLKRCLGEEEIIVFDDPGTEDPYEQLVKTDAKSTNKELSSNLSHGESETQTSEANSKSSSSIPERCGHDPRSELFSICDESRAIGLSRHPAELCSPPSSSLQLSESHPSALRSGSSREYDSSVGATPHSPPDHALASSIEEYTMLTDGHASEDRYEKFRKSMETARASASLTPAESPFEEEEEVMIFDSEEEEEEDPYEKLMQMTGTFASDD